MKKTIKIYLAEHVPSLNKGEEAIIEGIYQGFKLCGIDPEISIFSYTPEIEEKRYSKYFKVVGGITFRPLIGNALSIWFEHLCFLIIWRLIGMKALYFFKKGNWKAYAEADLILVGHDGLISDLNLLFALYVKLLKKKSAILGGGFKKFRFRLSEIIAPYVLKYLDAIVVRQKSSYDYLVSLGVKGKQVEWRPDPAFLLEPAYDDEIEKLIHIENIDKLQRPLIGMIIVSGSIVFDKSFSKITDKEERYSAHIQFMARICENIIHITKGTIIFLPHCIGHITASESDNRDDRICARDVYKEMTMSKQKVVLIENEYNAATLKGFISKLDFIISERLHAIIAAASVGTPFIALTVEEDIRTQDIITETVGMEELIFNINDPSFNKFIEKFKKVYNRRDRTKKNLLKTSNMIKENCYLGFKRFKEVIWG